MLGRDELLDMYRRMLTIRRFEETIWDLYTRGLMPGMAHLYIGEEAVAVGSCAALEPGDFITSTHRGHGHCIAKGGDLKRMMAEMLGRATGYCRGRGGTMHIADIDLGILGANGIVGGGLGIAVGAALACQMRRTGQVVICFFGDGASNQGIFHEALNLASLWKLPVVFVCENNLYGYTVAQSRAQAIRDISIRGAAYAMSGVSVDGMDVEAVYGGVKPAVDRARAGEGPSLIEAKTYRFMGHTVGEPGTSYRTSEEVESWKARDAIVRLGRKLLESKVASSDELEAIDEEVHQALEEAVEFAQEGPFPELTELEQFVLCDEGE